MRDVELDIMSRPPEHNTTNLDLDRMNLMLDIPGLPEQSFRVIHITGTNGKGSTTHGRGHLAAPTVCAPACPRRRIWKINERIAIDGQQLSDDDFIDIWDQTKDLVALVDAKMEEQRQAEDELLRGAHRHGHLEVRRRPWTWPSSRSAWEACGTPPTCSTRMRPSSARWTWTTLRWLGDTVEQIATEKAGIIKPNCTAIIGPQPHEEAVMPILAEAAERNHAMLSARRLQNDRVRPYGRSQRPSRHPDHAQRHLRGACRSLSSASISPQRACRAPPPQKW